MRQRPSTSPIRRSITPNHERTTFRYLYAAIAAGARVAYCGAAEPHRVPLSNTLGSGDRVAWVVPARRDAVGLIRHATASVLAERCSWVPVEHVLLVVSELVTNALGHGVPPCVLYLQSSPGRLLVAVYDSGPGFLVVRRIAPRVRRTRIPATSLDGGRGLHLINELTDSWQVLPMASGTTIIAHWRATTKSPGAVSTAR